MDALQAPTQEHVLLAAEWSGGVVHDPQQFFDPLRVLAHGRWDATHAEEPLRALDGRFATVEAGRDEDDSGGIIGIEFAEVLVVPVLRHRRPAIHVAPELTRKEPIFGLLD